MHLPELTQLSLINVFKFLLAMAYLFFILLIIAYNWLYLSRTLQANSQIGLTAPDRIDHLVKASTVMAMFTAVLIGFVLVTRLY